MQEREQKKIYEGNFYLISLIVGAVLFLGLSLLYAFSAKIALGVKYPNLTEVSEEIENMFLSIIQLVYSFPIIGLFIYLFRKDLKNEAIDFKKGFSKYISYIVLGIFGCMILTGVVGQIYSFLGIEGDSQNQATIDGVLLGRGALPMIISVVIVAPFTEEMLFRKILYGTCEKKFMLSPATIITIITLVFALIHVTDPESMIFVFQYIPLSFIITYSYYKSKNIFVPMGIHFLNNLASVLLFYLASFLGA